jgi:D-alanine-D-alanine ligase
MMRVSEAVRGSGRGVVVLCGGSGAEREVSIRSGEAVSEALAGEDIPVRRIVLDGDALPEGLDARRDLVLPLVHGTYGEDGRMSAALEAGGFAYGGSDAASSALAFDKIRSKELAARLGLSVARHVRLEEGHAVVAEAIVEQIGVPFVLKPCSEGSSVGLMVLGSVEEALDRLPKVADRVLMAEQFCPGVDATVAILGGAVLGSVSIHPEGGVYDYAHKYTSGLTRYACPAEIEPDRCRLMEADALRLFRASGCRDLARIDFRVADGAHNFLEVNTLPGMTATSLFPMAAKACGMSFPEVLLRWVEFVLERLEEQDR